MNKINRIAKIDGRITKQQIKKPTPVYNVRIAQEVYEPMVKFASEHERSITAQINFILKEWLKSQKEEHCKSKK